MTDRRFTLAMMTPIAALALAGCGINSVPTAEEKAKEEWANVEAAYQRRADLIPILVQIVSQSVKSEGDILADVTNARAGANNITLTPEQLSDPAAVERFRDAQGQITVSMGRLVALQEQYPNLKSQERFADFMVQLESSQNRINARIDDYNAAVRAYNTTIRTFPDAIGAKIIHGAKPMAPYRAVTPNANVAPKVDFGK